MNGRTPEGQAKIDEHVRVFNNIFVAFSICAKSLIAKGGHVINEWPTGCKYWRIPKVHKTFAKLKLNHSVLTHGCALGLKSVAVKDHYIKKPWKLRASFPHLTDAFEKALCPGVSEHHKHTPCAGVDTKLSEECTPMFVKVAHSGILAHARMHATESAKTPISGSSSDACTGVVTSNAANDVEHVSLVKDDGNNHACTPRLADPVSTTALSRANVNNNGVKRVTALPVIIKAMNLKHIVCACVVNHTSSTMASHSHSEGSGRETEYDDDMRDIWPNARDDSAPSGSAASGSAATSSNSVAEPSISLVVPDPMNEDVHTPPPSPEAIVARIGELCIDPAGSDAPNEGSTASSAHRDTIQREHRERCDRMKIVIAENRERHKPITVKATPPHRATIAEQQDIQARLTLAKATAVANRKDNLAVHGTPNLDERPTDFLDPDSEEELTFGAAPTTNVPRGPAEPMGWPARPNIALALSRTVIEGCYSFA